MLYLVPGRSTAGLYPWSPDSLERRRRGPLLLAPPGSEALKRLQGVDPSPTLSVDPGPTVPSGKAFWLGSPPRLGPWHRSDTRGVGAASLDRSGPAARPVRTYEVRVVDGVVEASICVLKLNRRTRSAGPVFVMYPEKCPLAKLGRTFDVDRPGASRSRRAMSRWIRCSRVAVDG
jgi:hypothetical protein